MKRQCMPVKGLAISGIVILLFLAGCGGGTASTGGGSNPVPTITAISPSSAVAGAAAGFTLAVNGTNFLATSTVNFGGTAPTTTFVSFTQLTAAIPAAAIASAGTAAVTVTNPAPGGGSSNSVTFNIATTAGFSTTQGMIKVSGVHTATLLPSGQVLVTGGCGGQDFLEVGQPDAELYDSASRAFSTTGSMQSARCRHTATLLPNGKVLVVGGFDAHSGEEPASAQLFAEIYDPAIRQFSQVDNMLQARAAHTATLLQNGKILITGGATLGGWGFPFYGSALASAELYDPVTNTFTLTGSMGTARFGHTATLLLNGKVLIAGGFALAQVNEQASSLASTEIYDPIAGTFSPSSDMTDARGGHAGTLLQDGRLLITGGFATAGPSTTVLSSAELYQPSTGVFSPAGNMIFAREEHTATLLMNGQVLIAGGATPIAVLATAELYDPAVGMFTGTDSMVTPRTGHSATLLQDGTVLVSGGDQSDGSVIPVYLSSAEVFLPRR